MKQFIVDRHTTPNTPTLEQVPTEKIPVYEDMAAAVADLANLAENQIIATHDTGSELSAPVDTVQSGNMHAVTSNAVAGIVNGESETIDGVIISKKGKIVEIRCYGVTVNALTSITLAEKYRPSSSVTNAIYVRYDNKAYLGFIGITSNGAINITYVASYSADNINAPSGANLYFNIMYFTD